MKKKQAVIAGLYRAIRSAAQNGHADIIWHLESHLTTKEIKRAVKLKKYDAIHAASKNGHLNIIQYFESHLTAEEKKQVIKGRQYSVIHAAAENGRIDILRHLESYLTADEKKQAAIAGGYSAIRIAAFNGHTDILNHFLNIHFTLAYLESHDEEYGCYIYDFVSKKLQSLKEEEVVFELTYPNGVFNIKENKASLYFYIIRNCIRRSVATNYREADNTLIDEIRFLLSIPAIKNLAHQAVTPGQPNELVRLALALDNAQAAALLLGLPEVRTLAEQNDYYQAEFRGELNLRQLAQNSESSMTVLTMGEQKRLEQAKKHYQPIIDSIGIPNIMAHLRQDLEVDYKKHPASMNSKGKTILLPLHFKAFTQLSFNAADEAIALQAYYQHQTHTAWRYLSKPNPWMSARASYVYINDDRTERWSTFEEYQSLIVLMYLAAVDPDIPATDNHTIEGRWAHFVNELYHIGRAHNWDKNRERDRDDGVFTKNTMIKKPTNLPALQVLNDVCFNQLLAILC